VTGPGFCELSPSNYGSASTHTARKEAERQSEPCCFWIRLPRGARRCLGDLRSRQCDSHVVPTTSDSRAMAHRSVVGATSQGVPRYGVRSYVEGPAFAIECICRAERRTWKLVQRNIKCEWGLCTQFSKRIAWPHLAQSLGSASRVAAMAPWDVNEPLQSHHLRDGPAPVSHMVQGIFNWCPKRPRLRSTMSCTCSDPVVSSHAGGGPPLGATDFHQDFDV
jgi:hypothetical protein